MIKRDDSRDFRLVQNLTEGGTYFNQFRQLRNQLLFAAENIGREEHLSPVLIATISKDMDEKLKPAHKVVDVVDRANTKICVTQLRYNVDKPESSYAQVRLFAMREEDTKFRQFGYVKYKLEQYIYPPNEKNSLYDKNSTNKPICNVP